MSGIVLLVAGTMLLQLLLPIGALANYTYTNEETGFKAVIEDGEDLLTDDEEQQLAVKMKELRDYETGAKLLDSYLADYAEPVPGARARVREVLKIMLSAYLAARMLQETEKMMEKLQ
jgi:hypothetical protein